MKRAEKFKIAIMVKQYYEGTRNCARKNLRQVVSTPKLTWNFKTSMTLYKIELTQYDSTKNSFN